MASRPAASGAHGNYSARTAERRGEQPPFQLISISAVRRFPKSERASFLGPAQGPGPALIGPCFAAFISSIACQPSRTRPGRTEDASQAGAASCGPWRDMAGLKEIWP